MSITLRIFKKKYQRFFLTGLVVLLTLVVSHCASVFKSGSNFKLRDYEEKTLSNGLKVLLIEDHRLPTFALTMLVKSGSSTDPEGYSGLSSLVASLLDQGTTLRSATELADSLGHIGASFGAGVTQDYTVLSVDGLSTHQERLLTDFSEIITKASFKTSEEKRRKKQVFAQLKKTVDNPSLFSNVIFNSYLYGDHPYAKRTLGSVPSLRKIKKKNIIKYYLNNYRPNNAILAVVGNYSDDILVQLEKKFSKWSPKKIQGVTFPKLVGHSKFELQLINKPGLNQSQIRLGHLGIKRSNPDYLALKVANSILGGGGMLSRLMEEIRVKKGLTYGIRSSFVAKQDPGPFLISTFSRHDKVGEVISNTMEVLGKFQKEGVSEKEVEDAKAQLIGTFPRIIETSESLARNILILRFYGVSDSYLEDYLSDMSKISKADVNGVIKKYFHPSQIRVLVYSSQKKVLSQLKNIGPVKVKNYTEFL